MSEAIGVRRKQRTALLLGGLVCVMVGLAFAAVPFYRWICKVTGYEGTTNTADAAPGAVGERTMTIRFDANVARGMPWRFTPADQHVSVRIGEQTLAFYSATNLTNRPVTGQATFNVTPDKVAVYFDKIECFCFTEQTLAPGETIEFPVSFFVDPEILKDRELDGVKTITLSYTFFEKESARTASAGGASGRLN